MEQQALEQQIINHEGLQLKPYLCPAGKLTIGAGRNIEDNGISKAEAMVLLRNDIFAITLRLEKVLPGFRALTVRRRNALIDMCYNLGLPRLLKFKKMLAALVAKDYALAADEMIDSAWANQVGQRARTLATMMREG